MVLVATFISQQDGWTVILRDEQVSGAIAVVVSGDDGARIFELNLVEADFGGDIFETVGAEIAEQAHLAAPISSFADCNEVDPAVVVVVKGGHAISADPVGFGRRMRSNQFPLSLSIPCPSAPPKHNAGRSCQRDGVVHPLVVIKIQRSNSDRRSVRERRPN